MSAEPGDPHGGPGRAAAFAAAAGRVSLLAEQAFFLALTLVFLLLGAIPIFCRLFALPSLSWTNSVTQHLMLWVALFGAAAATRDRKHISVDAVSHYLPARGQAALRAFTGFAAAVICCVLFPISVKFAESEGQAVGDAVAFLNIPQRWLPYVIPVGLALLIVRFLIAAWADLFAALYRQRRTSIE